MEKTVCLYSVFPPGWRCSMSVTHLGLHLPSSCREFTKNPSACFSFSFQWGGGWGGGWLLSQWVQHHPMAVKTQLKIGHTRKRITGRNLEQDQGHVGGPSWGEEEGRGTGTHQSWVVDPKPKWGQSVWLRLWSNMASVPKTQWTCD